MLPSGVWASNKVIKKFTRPKDAQELRGFLRELERAHGAAFACDRVCPVLGLTEMDGKLAVIMTKYEANLTTLRSSMEGNRMPTMSAMRIARSVAQALAALHGRGIVHGNLKPSNILARPSGDKGDAGYDVVVSDLSVTAMFLRQSGTGTLLYQAPEQHANDSGYAGPESDVWSLGIVVCELLAGAAPYEQGLAPEHIRKLLVKEREPPRVPTGLPAGLQKLLSRMLAIEPSRRPTAAKVARALQALLQASC